MATEKMVERTFLIHQYTFAYINAQTLEVSELQTHVSVDRLGERAIKALSKELGGKTLIKEEKLKRKLAIPVDEFISLAESYENQRTVESVEN